MAQVDQHLQTKAMTDFLAQLRQQGTPLRFTDTAETYYVLTATQLLALMQSPPLAATVDAAFPDESALSLVDFGLTEDDLIAYEAEQQRRQMAVNSQEQYPLRTDLAQRLDALCHSEHASTETTQAEREQILAELEAAMAENLRVLVPNAA